MLILQLRILEPADEVIIRDATGRAICEVGLSDIRGGKARLSFLANPDIKINRRSLDVQKDWQAPKVMGTCVVCHGDLNGRELDGTGMAHAICTEKEKH